VGVVRGPGGTASASGCTTGHTPPTRSQHACSSVSHADRGDPSRPSLLGWEGAARPTIPTPRSVGAGVGNAGREPGRWPTRGGGGGSPCPERGGGGCVVAALVEGARLEPPDRSGTGPRKWRRRLLGTAESSDSALSLWRPPGAVGLRRRFVKSGGKKTAQAADKSSDGAVSEGARCRGAPPPSARRGSVRSGLRGEAGRGERGGRRERS